MSVMLALFFAGYFVLGGLDYGVAVVARDRSDLDRLAPFFLGNEVWLVAAVGVLFGAFPLHEGELLSQQRVPVAVALAGVVMVTASYGLRLFSNALRTASRPQSRPAHTRVAGPAVRGASASPGGTPTAGPLDGVARIGGALAALGWGAALAGVWQGGDFRVTPLVGLGAFGFLALLSLHGWAFLRRRWMVFGGTTAAIVAYTVVAGSAPAWHAADSATLALVAPTVYVLLPILLLAQAATWWMFRARHHREASVAG